MQCPAAFAEIIDLVIDSCLEIMLLPSGQIAQPRRQSGCGIPIAHLRRRSRFAQPKPFGEFERQPAPDRDGLPVQDAARTAWLSLGKTPPADYSLKSHKYIEEQAEIKKHVAEK